MGNSFEDLDLGRLRRRRSEKWRLHPPDVLPAFIAEMDYDLAEPVLAALRSAVDRSAAVPTISTSAVRDHVDLAAYERLLDAITVERSS